MGPRNKQDAKGNHSLYGRSPDAQKHTGRLFQKRNRKWTGGMNSRNKGKRGELELAQALRNYGYQTRRAQQYCGTAGDADLIGLDGIHIECKRVEKLNIHEAVDQAVSDAREKDLPCVFHRKNRTAWLVTMRLEDWLKMYGSYGS